LKFNFYSCEIFAEIYVEKKLRDSLEFKLKNVNPRDAKKNFQLRHIFVLLRPINLRTQFKLEYLGNSKHLHVTNNIQTDEGFYSKNGIFNFSFIERIKKLFPFEKKKIYKTPFLLYYIPVTSKRNFHALKTKKKIYASYPVGSLPTK